MGLGSPLAAGGCASVFVVVFVFAAIGSAWAVVFNRITSLPPAVHHAHLAAVHHRHHRAIEPLVHHGEKFHSRTSTTSTMIDNKINAIVRSSTPADESGLGNTDGDYNEPDIEDRQQ